MSFNAFDEADNRTAYDTLVAQNERHYVEYSPKVSKGAMKAVANLAVLYDLVTRNMPDASEEELSRVYAELATKLVQGDR